MRRPPYCILAPTPNSAASFIPLMATPAPQLPENVSKALYFRNDASGRTWSQSAFVDRYGFEPDGVNGYYGVNNAAVAHWQMKGEALRSHHRVVLDDLLAALLASRRPEKTLNLGLWPFQPPEPYGFVENHLSLIETLAVELAAYQQRARDKGKKLDVVVRYASEMSDPAKPGQPWGRGKLPDPEQAEAYRETFALVRRRFHANAPEVRFAFSPAIRADIRDARYDLIADYWPGDDLVDVVSCTWYVGREGDFPGAVSTLQRYIAQWKDRGKAFGIDEIGGINEDAGNDAMLQRMFGVLAGLRTEGVRFDYVTLFLASKWRTDAQLKFLRPEPVP